jgi:multidrug transporter EmrE-like cation transporter
VLAPSSAAHNRRAILLVASGTLLGAAAQILIKMGAGALGQHASLLHTAIGMVTIPSLFLGYSLYAVYTVILVVALREGELSLLYPVIALTFVWVTIASVLVFHEHMNAAKLAGIAIIMAGVAVLGGGGKK